MRYIFIPKPASKLERIVNVVGPVILGLTLAIGALEYFDVLTK